MHLRWLYGGDKFPKGVIIHSERGSQYCSAAYQNLLDGGMIKNVLATKDVFAYLGIDAVI